jgi:hypothetical protein
MRSLSIITGPVKGKQVWHLKNAEKRRVKVVETDKEDLFLEIEEDDFILCRQCGHPITTLDHIIAVNGQHAHTHTNPAGITYRIGCFSSAPGCLIYGERISDFTWFEGFSWCLALCSYCLTHLGWHYQSPGSQFFGLILDNLIENIRTH